MALFANEHVVRLKSYNPSRFARLVSGTKRERKEEQMMKGTSSRYSLSFRTKWEINQAHLQYPSCLGVGGERGGEANKSN